MFVCQRGAILKTVMFNSRGRANGIVRLPAEKLRCASDIKKIAGLECPA